MASIVPPGRSSVPITEIPTEKIAYEVDCALRALTRNHDDHNEYTGPALVYLKELMRRVGLHERCGTCGLERGDRTAHHFPEGQDRWSGPVDEGGVYPHRFVAAEQEAGLSDTRESSKQPPAEPCLSVAPNISPGLHCEKEKGHEGFHTHEGIVWVGGIEHSASRVTFHEPGSYGDIAP